VRAKILDGEIVTAKIADLAVTGAKIADLAVTTAKIAQAAITNAQIANAAVDTAQIALGAITAALIAQGAVGTAQIADASITDAKIVELTANKINAGTLSVERLIIRGNNQSLIYAINNMGELVSAEVDTIDGYVLTERTIMADKIVVHSITANELAAHTITANEILAGTITGNEIAAATIEGSNIKAGTLTTSHVAADFGQSLDLSSNQSVAISVERAMAGMEVGGRNYALNSDSENTGTTDLIARYTLAEAMEEDEKYTVSLSISMEDLSKITVRTSGGDQVLATINLDDVSLQTVKVTFTAQYASGKNRMTTRVVVIFSSIGNRRATLIPAQPLFTGLSWNAGHCRQITLPRRRMARHPWSRNCPLSGHRSAMRVTVSGRKCRPPTRWPAICRR